MGLFDRLFGKGRHAAQARAAELRGDLGRAAELFGEAGMLDEAARVLVVRGEGETDPQRRLQYFTQGARLAPEGTDVAREAKLRRADLLLALAGDATVSAVARQEVLEAARDLEANGEPLKAAAAYARAGDTDGEARALQAAGDVERLEFLLSTEQHRERVSRARDDRSREIDLLVACGRRREALAELDDLVRTTPDDPVLRERANSLRARRVLSPVVALDVAGDKIWFVLGDEVVLGRTEGAIHVPSSAVSREHLRISRRDGRVFVRDLESRNGTQLRGINLAGELDVGEGLELKLGREVPLRIAPSTRVANAIEIGVSGRQYVACLGPTSLPAGLALTSSADDWVELVGSAYLGEMELVPHATLLVGDAIATERGEPAVVRVLSV